MKLMTLTFLTVSVWGFSQIPNFPNMKTPEASSLGNYSNQTFSNPRSNVPAVPNNYLNGNLSKVEEQNRRMVMEDFKRVEAEEKERKRQQSELNKDAEEMKFRGWVENGRSMSYDLPTYAGKAGIQSYYDAFDKLSSMDSENYSLADVNFTVENAFYDNKRDLKSFKSGIQKTAKQLLQKMKERKQDTESDVSKNLMIFEYFSKDMNLGGTTHKAFEYDFKDYLGEKDWSKMFVSKLLKTGSGQCHSLPQYYLMLAEAMGTEAYLSLAPNHSYIRFIDDEGKLRNIELTNGMFSTDTSLLESGYIKSEALQNKIYMNNLTKKELLGMAYFDLARGYVHKFGYDEFVNKVIDKALELYPNGISPNMEKANVSRARLLSVLQRLGINPQDKNDLQRTGYFPKAVEQFKQLNEQFNTIDNLGYAEMPASAYESWLASLKTETSKQESEALAQRIRLYQLQKQKEKQEQDAVKKAQEKKKQEQKPRYIPIDPSKL
ncbi:hypothetical protein [Chryseobacterium oryctis]|uniref:Transglutaminase-like superfamily protein n=1 Tax=Chryseobacterium oryctis TaxID=2952618 RepID=A0ABT3HJ65_9FLAO|nr:hypothetical protein [Chryseobacterium oryctis]MCW3159685.1 hypothetical protein [Chryseobacterium oryctis]